MSQSRINEDKRAPPPSTNGSKESPGGYAVGRCLFHSRLLCRSRRLRVLVDFGFGELTQRGVGVLFFLQRGIKQLDGIL